MSLTNGRSNKILSIIFSISVMTVAAGAQEATPPAYSIAAGNNLYCAGYVQTAPVDTSREIVGAENEADKHIFAQGDQLIVNVGAAGGVNVGDKFAVIRPKGEVSSKWSKKKDLGFYVQEIGTVEVVGLRQNAAIVRVKTSCEAMLIGDLLAPMENRDGLVHRVRPELNVFAASTGKTTGRIFMARDGKEMIARDQIVYIDLGAEDNVRVGDYLTIFRPLGKGNIFDSVVNESVEARNPHFQSKEYGGGEFSILAGRKKGEKAGGRTVATEKVKSNRPEGLRKIVGELVILNVKEKTATAVVVRNRQEIHTGDFVELQ